MVAGALFVGALSECSGAAIRQRCGGGVLEGESWWRISPDERVWGQD